MSISSPASVERSAATPRVPITVRVVQPLLGVLAFVAIVGSFLFIFPQGTLFAYAVGAVFVAGGLTYVTLTFRLARGERGAWLTALGVTGAHLLFNVWKVTGEHETESVPILGVSIVVVALLALPATRRFFTR
jgi:hypothetical protein